MHSEQQSEWIKIVQACERLSTTAPLGRHHGTDEITLKNGSAAMVD